MPHPETDAEFCQAPRKCHLPMLGQGMFWGLKINERSQASRFHIWFECGKLFRLPEIEKILQ